MRPARDDYPALAGWANWSEIAKPSLKPLAMEAKAALDELDSLRDILRRRLIRPEADTRPAVERLGDIARRSRRDMAREIARAEGNLP